MSPSAYNRSSTTSRFEQVNGPRRIYRVWNDGGADITLDDGATPFLEDLARRFPDLANRALRHIGHWLGGDPRKGGGVIKLEMAAGAPGGRRYEAGHGPGWSRYRVLDWYRKRLRQGRNTSRDAMGNLTTNAYRKGKRAGAGKYTTLGPTTGLRKRGWRANQGQWTPPGGGLIHAVGFSPRRPQNMEVRVGWLSPSAALLGKIFQGGKRTPVTMAMRRLFLAAGIAPGGNLEAVLKRGGTIQQPARPVMMPVFQRYRQEIPRRFELRMQMYLREALLGREQGRRQEVA